MATTWKTPSQIPLHLLRKLLQGAHRSCHGRRYQRIVRHTGRTAGTSSNSIRRMKSMEVSRIRDDQTQGQPTRSWVCAGTNAVPGFSEETTFARSTNSVRLPVAGFRSTSNSTLAAGSDSWVSATRSSVRTNWMEKTRSCKSRPCAIGRKQRNKPTLSGSSRGTGRERSGGKREFLRYLGFD